MPLGDPLPGILDDLRAPEASTRVRAARRLAGWEAVPEQAATTLVLALEDEDGTEYEEWTDWAGAVVGGELHQVPHLAAEALGKCGGVGLELAIASAVGGASGARALLPRVLLAARADELRALGSAERARALPFTPEAGDVPRTQDGQPLDREPRLAELAHRCLTWADEEDRRGEKQWPMTARRLEHPRPEDARAAAEAMADCPDRVWAAATLVDFLLVEDLAYPAEEPAAASLEKLGPVLDERRLQVLLEAVGDHRPFGALGPLFRALAAHGRPAEPLRPTLERWLRPEAPRQIGRAYHDRLRLAARRALEILDGAPGGRG